MFLNKLVFRIITFHYKISQMKSCNSSLTNCLELYIRPCNVVASYGWSVKVPKLSLNE